MLFRSLVYDSRLEADPSTDLRVLQLNTNAHPALKASGISYVPVLHESNTQSSLEEALVVNDIYNILLNQSFAISTGELKNFTNQNILIVAPYNLHVHLLTKVLGKEARVGTVDKFQGQEAPIIIYSMVTSSAADAPRGMDFLYNANRFNVAVSRARAAVILVGSPLLFEPECKTPDQMKLANGLCYFMEKVEN